MGKNKSGVVAPVENEYEQEVVIFSKGNLVDSVIEEEKIFVLYSIRRFYVEIEYGVIRFCIASRKAFRVGQKLVNYLFWG